MVDIKHDGYDSLRVALVGIQLKRTQVANRLGKLDATIAVIESLLDFRDDPTEEPSAHVETPTQPMQPRRRPSFASPRAQSVDDTVTDRRNQIVTALKHGPLFAGDLRQRCGFTKNAVYSSLRSLRLDGIVESCDGGYRLTPAQPRPVSVDADQLPPAQPISIKSSNHPALSERCCQHKHCLLKFRPTQPDQVLCPACQSKQNPADLELEVVWSGGEGLSGEGLGSSIGHKMLSGR